MQQRIIGRRSALVSLGGSILVVGTLREALACSPAQPKTNSSASPPPPSSPPPAASAATRTCAETHDQIEGPYYRARAPERWDLTEAGMPGTVVEVEGRVTSIDCTTALKDAELDVWQATSTGHYDNDGTMGLPESKFLLRGRLRADGDGRFRIKTIVPGRYLNGKQYRPAHIHVKLRAKDHATLTTQLYFPDDPFNKIDPFLHESLIMDVKKADSGLKARFDFVLKRS